MSKDKFQNLRYRLMESDEWPMRYMFKFITPNNSGKVDKVKALLPEHGKTTYKHTSSLKYVSITCVAVMSSADEIIEISEQVDAIGGIMTL